MPYAANGLLQKLTAAPEIRYKHLFRINKMKNFSIVTISIIFLIVGGCEKSQTPPVVKPAQNSTAASTDTATIVITPGADAQKKAQEAFILAKPGDVIEFAEGKFEFDGTISLVGIADVTVRGKGMEKTILNFAKFQDGKGGEGVKVKADRFTIEDLTIEDTPGDAIKLQDCNGLTMRRIRTWWTNGPSSENGAYGLYPVLSNNVLIENCVAQCASDAGIYVGQSKQIIVRNCVTEKNVAGIEIENCIGADVYNNVSKNNAGGILVFSLPGLTIKNGTDCRVFNNTISSNNHVNFAKAGAMVATVPSGTGLMIMANDRVEASGNTFDGNAGAGCLIVSFLTTQRQFDDAQYDPYPEAVSIKNNVFKNGGSDPQGDQFKMFTDATGQNLPDIVYDGILDPKKLVDEKLPTELGVSIIDNGDATFVNLDLGTLFAGSQPNMTTDITEFAHPLPPVKTVTIEGVE